MNFAINLGTGPIAGATLDDAYANMRVLLKDAGLEDATFARDVDAVEAGGRFSFDLAIPGYTEEHGTVPIDMPGCSLSAIRYLPDTILIHPRLYIDGSSWEWQFAVTKLRDWKANREAADRGDEAYRLKRRREREADEAGK